MRISDWSSDVCSSDLVVAKLLDEREVDVLGCHRVIGGEIEQLLQHGFATANVLARADQLEAIATIADLDAEPQSDLPQVRVERAAQIDEALRIVGFQHQIELGRRRGIAHARAIVSRRPCNEFAIASVMIRSDERRVGKGWVSTCESRWEP